MKEIIQEYYVLEREGKFYGEEYSDGKCTCNSFVPIEHSETEPPLEKIKKIDSFAKRLIDEKGLSVLTYRGNEKRFLKDIEGANLRKMRVTTNIEFVD